jgi:hypothetical protein
VGSPEPSLASQEDVEASLERDRALTSRALRQREEIVNARQRFELRREKIYLGLELIVLAIAVLLAVVLWVRGKEAVSLVFLGGGASFGGLAALLHHRSGSTP